MSDEPKFFERKAALEQALDGADAVTARALAKTLLVDTERKAAMTATERMRKMRASKRLAQSGTPVTGPVTAVTRLARVSEIRDSLIFSEGNPGESEKRGEGNVTEARVTKPVTAVTESVPETEVAHVAHIARAPRTYWLEDDESCPSSIFDYAIAAGYEEQEIDVGWERFRDHQISNSIRGTSATFRNAFMRWLREDKRRASADADANAQEVADEKRRLALRVRESKLLDKRYAAAMQARCGPTEAALALAAHWEQGEPPEKRRMLTPAQRLAALHGAPDERPWTPPTPEQRAAVAAELAELVRRSGGIQ